MAGRLVPPGGSSGARLSPCRPRVASDTVCNRLHQRMQSVTAPIQSRQGEDMFSARSVAAAVAFCVILHTAVFAQVTSGDIVGRVTDSSGAVLPGATVTIEHLGTHDTRTVPSNGTGDFVFNLLPIGAYTVKIELQGFITQTARVSLSAGDRARFDA